MAKLINILAASVGGGLVLGASIRLGEAIGSSARASREHRLKRISHLEREGVAMSGDAARTSACATSSGTNAVNSRLDRLEEKLSQAANPRQTPVRQEPEWQTILSGVVARIDRQQQDLETIRRQMSGTTRALDSVGEIAGGVRNDIHRQLREELDRRLTAVEENLHLSIKTSIEASQREAAGAMVASIEARVAPRISRLEKDVDNQSAAMAELRDCSLQSERSIQRLLAVLERAMGQKGGPAETAPETRQASAPTSPTDAPRLTVMASREHDEHGGEISGARRPASFR